MENFGYKEGSTKPKRRLGTGTRSIKVKNQQVPIPMKPRFSLTPDVTVHWRNDPEVALAEDFEYMKIGPSPPAESAPNMFDNYEESNVEFGFEVSADTIRTSLMEQMRLASGRLKLLDNIEQGNIIANNVKEMLEGATRAEKNISFLFAAFLKRWDLLEGLLECGAELTFFDNNGFTALHLSSFSGCLNCSSFLVGRGLEVNMQPKALTPLHCAAFGDSMEVARFLISKGSHLNTNTKKPNCEESLLHCAVRANAINCVKLFITEGMDVNSLKPSGMNAIHLAADLSHVDCLRVLLESPDADPNIRIGIREKESTALHLAADEGNVDCVTLLLAKGANAKLKNHRGFTPLHLAARTSSLECVELLLRVGNADPNAEDFDQRTPLHTAIGKSDSSLDIIETLICWGSDINRKDVFGFTALHLAALDGLAHCVEILIYHDADVTTKSKKGTTALNVITRKTPASLAMIRRKFDDAMTLIHLQDPSDKEVVLELDFRSILQHCYPREISYLNTLVDEGQKEILQHPLCSAFLYIKWGKIRKYYIARLLFCFIFILFLTLYVLTALAHNCYNGSKDMEETIQEQELCQKQSILGNMLRNNPFVMEMQWIVLVAITFVEICRKLYGMTGYSSIRRYITQMENVTEWFIIVSVFVISYIYTKRTYTWQNHIGAFAVLLGWTHLMVMIGQLPVFGAYVAMYTKVQVEFAKLFIAYSCMLVGFTISFCVIFPSSSSFENPFMGFITVLVMMVGELDLELLINDPDGKDPPFMLELSAQITFVLFLLFVTVILMNLLVGIAVDDIQALKKTATLSKLVGQTKLISYIESALFSGWLPNWLRSLLHYTALVSPQAYRVILSLKPLNPEEKRLPRPIMMAAYEAAMQLKHPQVNPTVNPAATPITNKYRFQNGTVGPNGQPLERIIESDYGFETASICTLTTKIDESSEKLDVLSKDLAELKAVMTTNQALIDKISKLLAK
ncbi:transient receptor potential channel pyrexia-like [Uranotaenia lowii]|uniref:transient receptor potential channel pyrexia-like n=1 Tax=Uranotaenia lowii TaxID=190385 RepID=UPI0024786A7A|nr:transient receptor potential channel pyrexia-like [Uranotaenia lowii]